jgi:hypothetical protein
MLYETTKDAMDTQEGRILYKILAMQFDRGLDLSPAIKARVERMPTYIGSQSHIESMVWAILNGLQQIVEIKETKRLAQAYQKQARR